MQFAKIPELPTNRSVYQIASASTCRSTWVAWSASTDVRNIQYCITLVRLEKRSLNANDPFASSLCDTVAPVVDHPNFSQMHCFAPHRSDIERFELTNLWPDSRYSIHVFVRLNGVSLFYDMLEILTNRYCVSSSADDEDDDDGDSSDTDVDSPPYTRMI